VGEESKARRNPYWRRSSIACRYIEYIVISVCGLDGHRKLVDTVLEGTDNPDKNRHRNSRHILISIHSSSAKESLH
jgi:hypothetical protein